MGGGQRRMTTEINFALSGKPAQFKPADEVEVALDHIAEEEKKLAAEGVILDADGSKESPR